MTDREAILASVEELIVAAVALLYPHCGEHVTASVLTQMAEEQARYRTLMTRMPAPDPDRAAYKH